MYYTACLVSFCCCNISLVLGSCGFFRHLAALSSRTQCRVIIQRDHLLDDGVILSSEFIRVCVLVRVIPALTDDPLLFAGLHVALEAAIVVADHAAHRVEKAIADVVGARWDQPGALNVVHEQRLAVRSDALEHFSVEASVTLGRIIPICLLEGQIVVEKVIS